MDTQTEDHGRQQAKAQLESILEMVSKLMNAAPEEAQDTAREEIQQDPLSVAVRGGWHSPGESSIEPPIEFNILLCTGGPAVRIIGELDEHQEPSSAQLEYQDWFTPWTTYPLTEEEESAVLAYCQVFYFGE